MSDLPPPIPAATLIVMRPAAGGGPPELLMMERPATMAFAAGALVFPGGRIEEGDHRTAEATGLTGEDAAARVAAVRETLEETGIAAATTAGSSDGIDYQALVPFARWCPNFRETRRFDALFFLVEAPADAREPTPQQGEVARVFWASAAATLAEIEAGRAHAIFPTRRNLERLARFASFAEAKADAEQHPVRTITPWVEQREGVPWLCIPQDLGYPVTAELLETAKRR